MDMVSDTYKIFFVFYHEEETVTLWEVKIDNMYYHENKVTQKGSKLLIRVEYKLCRIDLFMLYPLPKNSLGNQELISLLQKWKILLPHIVQF